MSVHYPVMLAEVLQGVAPKDGGVYVDGTFGNGGYSEAILKAADCRVIAIDRDETVRPRAEELAAKYGERFTFLSGCFGDVKVLLSGIDITKVDGFVLDIGVSSMQIDQAERGFSFKQDGPLDMRMGHAQRTAADIVNEMPEADLATLIFKYGEEKFSRRIAFAITQRRAEQEFTRTGDLADVIRGVVPKNFKDKIDPATRTFQALRIAVNDELGELERAIESAKDILAPRGRMAVVTFHSLEDRIVKDAFRTMAGQDAKGSRHLPDITQQEEPEFDLISRKPVKPSEKEIEENARSRSAKLRVIERRGV